MSGAFRKVLLASGILAPLPALAADRLFVALQDFDDLPLGPLGEPWSIRTEGAGTATVIEDGAPGDHVLLLDGSGEDGHFLVARIDDFAVDASPVALQLQVRPDPEAGWIVELGGAGESAADRRIRLVQRPGSEILEARTPFGTTSCGIVPSGVWSKVELLVSFTTLPTTFEVRIDDVSTRCTELAASIDLPVTSVSIADAPRLGWSGTVSFDDVHLWAGVN